MYEWQENGNERAASDAIFRTDNLSSQYRKVRYFFLIQLDTVVRETPKVRVSPRKLLRS